MSELITRTARLAPYVKRPRQASGFVTAYTYEPLPDDPSAKLGNLFVVLEVISTGRMADEVASLVIETMQRHYYDNADRIDRAYLDRFEAAIKATNAELAHYIDQGNAAWVGKLSAVVVVQVEHELHLAQTGSAEAFLARGKSSTRITAEAGSRNPQQPNKTFGAITSGELETNDRLLLATPALIHQLPLDKLRSIIAHGNPSSAIAEISGLLDGPSTMRIAALVVEVTTPEQAALQLRSDEPDDVVLNPNETPLEIARQAAAPLAQSAVATSKKLGGQTAKHLEAAKPHARQAALWTTRQIRGVLTSRGKERRLVLTTAIGVIIIVIIIISLSHHRNVQPLKQRFQADVADQSSASSLINSNKTAAISKLTAAQNDLNSLARNPQLGALNRTVAPNSVAALQAKVQSLLDQAQSLQRVKASKVASFGKATMTHLELLSPSQAIAVSSDGKTIETVNLQSGALTRSSSDKGQLGAITATCLDSNDDGIYILTKNSNVWLYRPQGDELTKQTISGGVPASLAIAAYNSNLYFLTKSGSVVKAIRSYSGFAAPITSLSASSELNGGSALAIDGSIYVLTNKGLLQYVGGVLQQTVAVPSNLAHATILRSVGDGTTVSAVSAQSHRLALFSYNNSTLSFSQQYAISGAKQLYDAVIDATTDRAYVLIDHSLVSFSLQ